MPYTGPISSITTRLIVTQQYHQVVLGETGEKVFAINGPDECMQRSVLEAIQELIELNGFLCFLFRSTPRPNTAKYSLGQPSTRQACSSHNST